MGALVVLAVATALNETACEKLEDPCTVSESVLVATIPEARGSTPPAFVRTDSGLAAMFFESETLTQADAGLLGQAKAVSIPSAVHVVVLDGLARAEQGRERFSIPSRLAGRKGSTSSFGVAWSRGQALFYWVESTTTTAADGRVTTSAKLVLESVDATGVEGPSIEPPDARCDDCTLLADAVDFAGVRLVVFAVSSSPAATSASGLGAPLAKSAAFALGPANEILPRTLPAALAEGSPPRFDIVDGVLTLVGNVFAPVDTSLALVGPVFTLPPTPLQLPSANMSLDLGGDSFFADFGVSGSFGGVGSTTGNGGLLVQRYRDGRATAPVGRIGSSPPVHAIARSADRLMVLHGDTTRYLSLAAIPDDPSTAPRKLGGDFVLDRERAQAVRLIGGPARTFGALTLAESHVLRREVTCEK